MWKEDLAVFSEELEVLARCLIFIHPVISAPRQSHILTDNILFLLVLRNGRQKKRRMPPCLLLKRVLVKAKR